MPSSALPPGYTARPASLPDLDTVLRLRNAQNQIDYGYAGLKRSDLRTSWLTQGFQIGMNHWLVFAKDQQPVAYGEIRETGTPNRFEVLAAAHNGPVPEQVGQFLLDQADRRAADLAAAGLPRKLAGDWAGLLDPTAEDEPPYRLVCRVGGGNSPVQGWVETAGFRLALTFNTMETDLTVRPPETRLPEGITIRAFQPGRDDQITYQVDEAAAVDKGYHRPMSYESWCKRMGRNTPDFDPNLWFLAFAGSDLAGVALNLYAPEMSTAWVDHLSVLRPYRQRGIGMALLMHSLNVFHNRCYPFARLSVDSHSLTHAPKLYERAGFTTVMRYHIYEK